MMYGGRMAASQRFGWGRGEREATSTQDQKVSAQKKQIGPNCHATSHFIYGGVGKKKLV